MVFGLAKQVFREILSKSVRTEAPDQHQHQYQQAVYLRDIFESDAYRLATSPLTIALGRDITGEIVVDDLAKMPHILIAGNTGSGISVAMNAMILSVFRKSGPDEVRFIMIDSEKGKLTVYEGIPHLLSPVIVDMKEAHKALQWCVLEMNRRFQLMAALGVRHITVFNAKQDAISNGSPICDLTSQTLPSSPGSSDQIHVLEKMPFIVVIIDELADLMEAAGRDAEEMLAKLAQKARATGIHLLLAIRRPSTDVLTGLIKVNIPTRMAFRVLSRVDSRIILDDMGAEQLLGQGEMLYLLR